jgi:hypothetical protein
MQSSLAAGLDLPDEIASNVVKAEAFKGKHLSALPERADKIMKRTLLGLAIVAASAGMGGCAKSSTQKAPPAAVERRRTIQTKWTLATNSRFVFLLIGDIKRDGDIVELWEKSFSCEEGSLSSLITHEQIDCSNKRSRRAVFSFDAAMASKEADPPADYKSVWNDDKCESPLDSDCWHDVVPDSPGEQVMHAACGTPTANDKGKL